MRFTLGFVISVLLLGGCSSSSDVTTTPPPTGALLDTYLTVDLSSGATSKSGIEPTYTAVGTKLYFKKIVVNGTTLYVTPIPLTQSQYRSVIAGGIRPWSGVPLRYRPASDTPDTPAYGLSQTDAAAVATAATANTGRSMSVISPDTWQAMANASVSSFPDPLTFTANLSWAYTAEAARQPGPREVSVSSVDPGGWHDVWGNVRCWLSDGRLAGPAWMDPLAPVLAAQIYDGIPPSIRHPLAGTRLQTSYP